MLCGPGMRRNRQFCLQNEARRGLLRSDLVIRCSYSAVRREPPIGILHEDKGRAIVRLGKLLRAKGQGWSYSSRRSIG